MKKQTDDFIEYKLEREPYGNTIWKGMKAYFGFPVEGAHYIMNLQLEGRPVFDTCAFEVGIFKGKAEGAYTLLVDGYQIRGACGEDAETNLHAFYNSAVPNRRVSVNSSVLKECSKQDILDSITNHLSRFVGKRWGLSKDVILGLS